jgi:GT2 family glycosyltransferase
LPDELIIVDSSDIPLIAQTNFLTIFNEQAFPQTSLLYRHTRAGLTYQRNVGIDLSNADIIYFFDDDVVLEPQYIKEMQRIFAGHPKYAGGSGSITNIAPYKRTFRYLIRKLFLIQRNYTSGKFTSSGMPTHSFGTTKFKEVETMSGCCSAYRSCVFNKHRFDEHLVRYAYMEDCDFSKRVSNNHKLFYNPFAKLAHNQSPLNREKLVDFRSMFSNYYTYLFFKNFYPEKKIRVFAYLWSMTGLFIESLYSTTLQCNTGYIRGYFRGIYTYIREQRYHLR